ncbi:hypothetical protein LUZ60_009597 [Juncus effusus]|nr:hypothetical protein LUZ60_009597 [Juncus effusus]
MSSFSSRAPSHSVDMAHPPAGEKTLAELSPDAVAHCAEFVDVGDIFSLSMTCKSLRSALYSDYIWSRLYKERWPNHQVTCGASDMRQVYLDRLIAVQQMKFEDPKSVVLVSDTSMNIHNHVVMDRSNIWASQGSDVGWYKLNSSSEMTAGSERLKSHGARITNMRLIPISDTFLSRNETKSTKNVLITSSADRTIRLWWKGKSQRCFKGHNGPVTALADKIVGSDESKFLTSGGEDCTVRVWSLGSNHKNNNHAVATFHGHQKPLSFLSVAWHKPSLLISISKDSKLRVWDTASSNSSPCVGSTSILGMPPVRIKCHDTNCYIATRSFINSIDLRTMQKNFSVPVKNSEIFSFEILPSNWMICTGLADKALLWDIRKLHQNSAPIAELESNGKVTLLHMDLHKIVTAGPDDNFINIFEPATGNLVNRLDCCVKDGNTNGVISMAVDKSRIVTAGFPSGELLFKDFIDCSKPVNLRENEAGLSKFWDLETQN